MQFIQVKLGVIIFGSVRFLSKKVTKLKFIFFEKKNQNRTETGSNRPVSVRFFRAKTSSNRFGPVFPVLARFSRFFRFWLGFFQFCLVFLFWLGFGSVFFWFFVGFGSVRFFRFFVYKTKTEPNWLVFSKI